MQKLTFAEIRKRYKEKHEKRLGSNNEVLKKRLEGYEVCREGWQYFIKVQDKQKACEEIVDSLIAHDILHHEKDAVKKYELLIETIPEDIRLKFPDTLRRHKGYVQYLINNRKEKKTQTVHSFRALETMLSLMDKEITEYSDDELSGLMKDKSFSSTQKQHAVWFIQYIYNQEPGQFKFNVEMSMSKRETMRQEEDFYTPEEWTAFMEIFFDVDRHIEKAYQSRAYARYWLYALLHMSLAWRKTDILSIPALENLIDISKYSLEWFENNDFTPADAQRIINTVKREAEQYHTRKTGAKKHFNIPQIALIPTAVAAIICEQWRRIEKAEQEKKDKKENDGRSRDERDGWLFGRFSVDTKRMTELFGLETDFSSMKANRTLLSMFNEKAGGINGLSGKAAALTSYMRSHKASKMGTANITKVYLHSTYDEKESASMGKQNIDRGFFGWLYDRLLDLADKKQDTFKENTGLIAQIKEEIPAWKLEGISGALYGIVKERDMLLDEIYSWHEDEIKEKTELLFSGKLLSRTDDVHCLKNGSCPYPTEDRCMLCRYSIPTAFSLTLAGDELKRLLKEFGKTTNEDVVDRINLTYQTGKLIMLLKEAIDRFGYEYIETYIDYEEINELIKKEAPNMVFIEEMQNGRKQN